MRCQGWAMDADIPSFIDAGEAIDDFVDKELAWYDEMIIVGMSHTMVVSAYMEHMRATFRHFKARKDVTDISQSMTFACDVIRWHLSDNYMIDFETLMGV